MNKIDVNYILDGQVELFDWLFQKKVGIDGDKNYVYLVQDKFRDQRYAKFVTISDPMRIKQHIAQLLIYQNTVDCKYIQPITDFTISKDKRMILITMPVPPRTLYSIIKDAKVDLRVRLFLVQNVVSGAVYMHTRRKCVFGQIRPESIAVYEDATGENRLRMQRRGFANHADFYAKINSFSTLIENQAKPEKWKWMIEELQYYDAPEIWSDIDRKKKNQITLHTGQSEKSVDIKPVVNKYTQKSDIWAIGLVLIELLSGMRIHEILDDKNVIPGRLLKQITIKQKILKQKTKSSAASVISGMESEKNEEQLAMTVDQFYTKICRHIESLAIKTIIEKMLSLKPEKRPSLQQVLNIVERLEVIDKRNKNISRMFSYKRSMKFLKETAEIKDKNPSENKEEDFDDRKSVFSMKSVRSGKSSKSHYSQTRKRITPELSSLLYARQAISQIHVQTVNPLYRTYFQDCKNRLPSDINFAPPPKKLLMRKEDKAIVLSLKGQEDQDIQKWKIDKVLFQRRSNYNSEALSRRVIPSPYSQSRVLADDHKKKYEGWMHSLQNEDESKRVDENQAMGSMHFGPVVKKIPQNSSTIKQYGYNDNLSNYHFLGVQNLKQQLSTQTHLHRKAPDPSCSLTPETHTIFCGDVQVNIKTCVE